MAAILDDELALVGDDIVEAHAALTDDATLFVEHDRRSKIDALRFTLLRIGDVGAAAPIRHRIVLQIAFAALVADRTIERMIHEQELEDHATTRIDLLVTRMHDHAVGDRRIAGDLQLGHAFDLDQTHAAESGRPKLRVIAIDRDLLLDRLGGLNQERALGHLDRHAVNGEFDQLLGGGAHASTVSFRRRASNWSGKRMRTEIKNGSIESPSAHRFKPVIA